LIEIFEINDITFINELSLGKLKPAIEQTAIFYKQSVDDMISGVESKCEYVYADLCEFKTTLFNIPLIMLVFFYQHKKIDILQYLNVTITIFYNNFLGICILCV